MRACGCVKWSAPTSRSSARCATTPADSRTRASASGAAASAAPSKRLKGLGVKELVLADRADFARLYLLAATLWIVFVWGGLDSFGLFYAAVPPPTASQELVLAVPLLACALFGFKSALQDLCDL